jgi:hypothetical protein
VLRHDVAFVGGKEAYDDEGTTWFRWFFVTAGKDADGEDSEGGGEAHGMLVVRRMRN